MMAVQYIILLASASISIFICSASAQGLGGSVVLVETPKANVDVDARSTVYYVCVGYGEDDPPSITWRFGDRFLINGSMINSASVTIYEKPVMLNNITFTQSILELCSVQVQDDGIYSCSAIGSSNASSSFELKVKVTNDTIGSTVQTLAVQAEESANNPDQQTNEMLSMFDNILSSVADFVSGPNASVIDDVVVENVVDTLNFLLHWTPESVMAYNNISLLVDSFETIVSQYAAQIPTNENRIFNKTSLNLLSENVAIETLRMSGRNVAFGIDRLHVVEMITSGGPSSQQVSLPASLFQRINDSPNVGMFYGVYNNSILFPVSVRENTTAERQTQVISNVVAVTVGQNNLTFEDPVVITLRLQKEGMYTASEMCVSWDFDLQEWTTRGCTTVIEGQGQVAVCKCSHLTNFAVLADVCSSAEACSDVLAELNNLNNTFNDLMVENYEGAVAMLSQAIGKSENSMVDQNPSVLSSTANYINQLATFFLNDSMVVISENVTRNVIQVVSSLLQWQPANIVVESSSRIIQSFETVLSLYAKQLPVNGIMVFNESSSVVLVAERRRVQSLVDNGRSVTIAGKEPETGREDQVTPGELSSEQEATIRLPSSLFRRINDTEIGMTFGFYNESTLFPISNESILLPISDESKMKGRQTQVSSLIASAIVGLNKEFPDLNDPVRNTFQLQIPPGMYMAQGSEMCAFWDFSHQEWNPQGCTTIPSVAVGQEGIVTCQCNHLTNFAVLVDICLRQKDCLPSKHDKALTFISYIGISISIVCLIVTIITLVIFEEVRKKDVSKFHIQLSLAILLMLTVALVFVGLSIALEGTMREYGGCVTVSVLLHYFTLVAVMWMGAEALLMFQKLVIVFVTITKKYIVTVSIVCWSVPIIPVLIPVIMDLVNGSEPGNDIVIRRGKDISFCFLSHVAAFWGAFLGPLLLVMVFNIIIFICVIVVLIRHLRTTAVLKKEAIDKKSIIRLMISIGGVMSLFGLTWLFAILTIQSTQAPELRETFQILFTVFNSLQGFFVFLFLCVIASDARDEWKKVFICAEFRSWLTQTSLSSMKSPKLKNSNGTSNTLDSKQANFQFTLDTFPKDKQAMA